jgi:hypothetical protein
MQRSLNWTKVNIYIFQIELAIFVVVRHLVKGASICGLIYTLCV